MESPLGAASVSVLLGVLFAYVLDRLEFPPFLGFFIAGVLTRYLLGVHLPEIYLQVLISLVAFEVGRQLGVSGLSPAAFFAVILETAFITGLSVLVFRLAGFKTIEALAVALMLLSSSSLLVLKLTQSLPTEARNIAMSLTTLEDTVLFFALSLLTGGTTVESLPVNLVVITILGGVSLALFSYIDRFIIGRDYALPFALATAFGFVYVVQYLRIASPYLGAFLAGYVFSRTDTRGVHTKEAAALSGLIIYAYMLAVGASLPTPRLNLLFFALSIAVALLAVLIRSVSVFFASLFVTGSPRLSAGVSLSTAHLSELSLTIPVLAYSFGVVKNPELVFALSIAPIFTLFIAPLVWRQRSLVESYVGSRMKELKSTVAYEKLYKVITRAFTTAAKLAILMVVVALAFSYMGVLSLVVLIPSAYFLSKYFREIYNDLLIALREYEGARYGSVTVLISTSALALYVAIALLSPILEAHVYIIGLIIAVLTYTLYVVYRELQSDRDRRLSSSTTTR
ncbi:cation:proton antiporter [Pyrobaculum sp.]|uniref:cation:proton antiporter domain-containing protein n=1 Tax=Pyrobaculum sp. TaxID=2004705 RepID=UPI003D0C8EA3